MASPRPSEIDLGDEGLLALHTNARITPLRYRDLPQDCRSKTSFLRRAEAMRRSSGPARFIAPCVLLGPRPDT
jgi:hypothetical protein